MTDHENLHHSSSTEYPDRRGPKERTMAFLRRVVLTPPAEQPASTLSQQANKIPWPKHESPSYGRAWREQATGPADEAPPAIVQSWLEHPTLTPPAEAAAKE